MAWTPGDHELTGNWKGTFRLGVRWETPEKMKSPSGKSTASAYNETGGYVAINGDFEGNVRAEAGIYDRAGIDLKIEGGTTKGGDAKKNWSFRREVEVRKPLVSVERTVSHPSGGAPVMCGGELPMCL